MVQRPRSVARHLVPGPAAPSQRRRSDRPSSPRPSARARATLSGSSSMASVWPEQPHGTNSSTDSQEFPVCSCSGPPGQRTSSRFATLPDVGTVDVRLDELHRPSHLRRTTRTRRDHRRPLARSVPASRRPHPRVHVPAHPGSATRRRHRQPSPTTRREPRRASTAGPSGRLRRARGRMLPCRLVDLQHELGAPNAAYREALLALRDEHLVRANEGRLEGLHQLRSRALARFVHENPPPLRSDTVARVLAIASNPPKSRSYSSVFSSTGPSSKPPS